MVLSCLPHNAEHSVMVRLSPSQKFLPSLCPSECLMAAKSSLFKETLKTMDSVKDVEQADNALVHGVIANISDMKKGTTDNLSRLN